MGSQDPRRGLRPRGAALVSSSLSSRHGFLSSASRPVPLSVARSMVAIHRTGSSFRIRAVTARLTREPADLPYHVLAVEPQRLLDRKLGHVPAELIQ
jgi:hypothetical protein